MMIIADFVRDLERKRFLRHEAFIAQSGGAHRYCVAPRDLGCHGPYPLTVLYEDQPFEHGFYAAALTLPRQDTEDTLQTTLDKAIRLISFLSDEPEWIDRVQSLPLGMDDDVVLKLFDISVEGGCRPAVKAWTAGQFLAPHNGGYAYFTVDLRGAIGIMSWSAALLPVALHFVSDREGQRTKLSSRVGKMAI